MNTKVKRVIGAPVTPAETMTDYMADKINGLMIACGIKEIEIKKYACGFGSRLHVTMVPFEDAPREIVAQGIVVKDAIAQLMSVVNLTKQTLGEFTEEEMNGIKNMWANAVSASKAPRAPVPATDASGMDKGEIPLDMSAEDSSPAASPAKVSCRRKKCGR